MAGHDLDDVDPHRVSTGSEAGQEEFRCSRYPSEALPVERLLRRFTACPRFHLDEGQHLAAPGDEVDFAEPGAATDTEDSPAVEAEVPGGEPFGAAAAALRLRAPAHRLS